jgi:microcystin-dependent protein
MADPYVGEIRIFAGVVLPSGWLRCDGGKYAISAYEVLYAVIGVTYGGDGRNNFAVPNLNGRLPVGEGATGYVLAGSGGSDQVTLTTENLPAHSHPVCASSQNATTGTAGPTVALATVNSPYHLYIDTAVATGTWASLNANAIGYSNGGNQAHDNVMPSVAVNYIICYNGLFPDFS